MRKALLILAVLVLCLPARAITKTPNLVAYFPLMGDALDHSGNGITTTVTGAVPAAGQIGGSYSFNGTSNYISFPSGLVAPAINGANRLTYAGWTYTPTGAGGTNYRLFVAQNSTGTYAGTSVARIPFFSINTSGGQKTLNGPSAVPFDTWTHLAYTWDGTYQRIYVNGTLAATSADLSAYTLTATDATGVVGSFSTTSGLFWWGSLQHVAIYNTALSQPDIKRVMLGLNPING